MKQLCRRIARTSGLSVCWIAVTMTLPARADVVSFSADGTSAPLNISGLNFEAGSAVMVGGDNATVGSTVQVLVQAQLGSVTLANGSVFTPTGLNGTGAGSYEITLVASVSEVVTNVYASSKTFAVASLQSSSQVLQLYFNPLNSVNPAVGTGYTTGNPILVATPSAAFASSGGFSYSETSGGAPVVQQFDQFGGTNKFPGVNTIVGSGSVAFGSNVTSSNANYFLSSPNSLTINLGISTPFVGADPSKTFADMPGGVPGTYMPILGSTNGLASGGGSDFQFQTQAAISFFVPEPSSYALIGVGLSVLAAFRWKQNRAITAAA